MTAGAVDAATIQALADRAAITDVLHAGCRILDANELGELGDVFTPECTVHFRPGAEHRCDGLDAVRRYLAAGAGRVAASSHHLTNIEMSVDADRADVLSYFYAWQRYAADDAHGETWGQYADRMIRTPHGWRITERRLLVAGSSSRGDRFPTPRQP